MDNFNIHLDGTYCREVCDTLEAEYNKQGKRLATVSIHEIRPASCLPMHYDVHPWKCRMHIPVKSNPYFFFVCEANKNVGDYEIWKMPDIGKVYKFPCDIYHTAVNASVEGRVHLVFDVVDIDDTL